MKNLTVQKELAQTTHMTSLALWHRDAAGEFMFYQCYFFHSTTGGRIATRIVALTLLIKNITTATNLVNFSHDIVWFICMGGDCT